MTDWMSKFIHSSNVEVDNEVVLTRFRKYQAAEEARESGEFPECPVCKTIPEYHPADPRLGCAPVPGAVVGLWHCSCRAFSIPAATEYVIGPFGGQDEETE